MSDIQSHEVVYGKPSKAGTFEAWRGFDHRIMASSEGIPSALLDAATWRLGGNAAGATIVASGLRDKGALLIEPLKAGAEVFMSVTRLIGFPDRGLNPDGTPAAGRHHTLARSIFFSDEDWSTHAPALLAEIEAWLKEELRPETTNRPGKVIALPRRRWRLSTPGDGENGRSAPERGGALLSECKPDLFLSALAHPGQTLSLQGEVGERSRFLATLRNVLVKFPKDARILASFAHGLSGKLDRYALCVTEDGGVVNQSETPRRREWSAIAEVFRRSPKGGVIETIRAETPMIYFRRRIEQGTEFDLANIPVSRIAATHADLAKYIWDAREPSKEALLALSELHKAHPENFSISEEAFTAELHARAGENADSIAKRHLLTFKICDNTAKASDVEESVGEIAAVAALCSQRYPILRRQILADLFTAEVEKILNQLFLGLFSVEERNRTDTSAMHQSIENIRSAIEKLGSTNKDSYATFRAKIISSIISFFGQTFKLIEIIDDDTKDIKLVEIFSKAYPRNLAELLGAEKSFSSASWHSTLLNLKIADASSIEMWTSALNAMFSSKNKAAIDSARALIAESRKHLDYQADRSNAAIALILEKRRELSSQINHDPNDPTQAPGAVAPRTPQQVSPPPAPQPFRPQNAVTSQAERGKLHTTHAEPSESTPPPETEGARAAREWFEALFTSSSEPKELPEPPEGLTEKLIKYLDESQLSEEVKVLKAFFPPAATQDTENDTFNYSGTNTYEYNGFLSEVYDGIYPSWLKICLDNRKKGEGAGYVEPENDQRFCALLMSLIVAYETSKKRNIASYSKISKNEYELFKVRHLFCDIINQKNEKCGSAFVSIVNKRKQMLFSGDIDQFFGET